LKKLAGQEFMSCRTHRVPKEDGKVVLFTALKYSCCIWHCCRQRSGRYLKFFQVMCARLPQQKQDVISFQMQMVPEQLPMILSSYLMRRASVRL